MLVWREFFLSWRGLAAVGLFYFLAKVAFSVLVQPAPETIEDYQIAQNLAAGRGYCLLPTLGPTAVKVPVYPLFLALFVRLFGAGNVFPIVVAQHILLAGVPLLLLGLGQALGMRTVGLCAGYLFLLHPSYFYFSNVIETTNLFVPLSILTAILCVRVLRSGDSAHPGLAGLASGVLILTQPLVAPCILAWTVLLALRKRWKQLVMAVVICLGVILPWSIRNAWVFHRFVPTKSPLWMNFYMGYMPLSHGRAEFDIIPESTKAWVHHTERTIDNVKMEAHYKDIFLGALRQSPLLYVRKTIRQAWVYWWIPPRYQADHSWSFLIVRKLPVIILNVFFIGGLVLFFRKNTFLGLGILLGLIYFTTVYALTGPGCIRFKLDIEWLELFPVAALLVRLRVMGTPKNGL